jgi:hypothetical protein
VGPTLAVVEDYSFVVGRSGYYIVRYMLHRLEGQPPVGLYKL